MPTLQQLPAAAAVNPTDEVLLGQGGNSVSASVAQLLQALPVGQGLTLTSGNTLQANLIMPEPCDFIHASLMPVSIIRPTSEAFSGAVAAVNSLMNDGLFMGQTKQFTDFLFDLAADADAAQRQL